MELRDLETGTRLELVPALTDAGRESTTYVSRLEWLEDENTAVIDTPIEKGHIVPVEPGTVFDVHFLHRKGKLINLYRFQAAVRERLIIDNLHVLLIKQTGEIMRVQRRSYFRLNCFIEVRYRIVSTDEEMGEDSQFRTTMASDLSGGGVRLLLDEKLEPGTLVECELQNVQTGDVWFRGVVVRFEDTGNTGRYKYTAGVAYIDIDENDREAVIRYIFNEQRRLIKKGLD